ncbi:hypothetical protein niasHT_033300 [Heterodera trifolii]|uniref:Uncharacterized protein n=1 Tax=Heterodera trifolii TaxID=157864 RepID=A0ABD2I1M0_9BILA
MSSDKTADENKQSLARRHLPQIRLGTKIGKLLRRQQQKNEREEDTVPNEEQQKQENDQQHNDANASGNGTSQNGEQLLPEHKLEVELNSRTTGSSTAEVTQEEASNSEQKSNANETEEHRTEIEKSVASHGPITAPEARQKWGKRRTSLVHPTNQPMPLIAPPIRPPNARRFGPSSPTPWVYLQMADRSFRRTTFAQLQANQQHEDGQQIGAVSANAGNLMLAPEFAAVKSALIVQKTFHRFALIVQGFIAGLTFGHALFAFFVADLHFLQSNVRMTAPVHGFFHFCLAIGVVDALDRFKFVTVFQIFCSLPSVGILACFFAFLASISSAQIEQLLAQHTVNDDPMLWDVQIMFTVWQLLSAVRSVCALFGWLTMAFRPMANATQFHHSQHQQSSARSTSPTSSSSSSSITSSSNFPFLAQGPTPDYVQEASEKARIEYWKIFTDDKGQLPKGELRAIRLKWAECHGMRDEYEMYEEEHEQKTDGFYKLMTANLGGDALKAFKKIWDITHNDELTRNEECRKAQDVMDGLKLRVRNMIPLLPYGISGIGPAPDCLPVAYTNIL